jgi:hypothetical protein
MLAFARSFIMKRLFEVRLIIEHDGWSNHKVKLTLSLLSSLSIVSKTLSASVAELPASTEMSALISLLTTLTTTLAELVAAVPTKPKN